MARASRSCSASFGRAGVPALLGLARPSSSSRSDLRRGAWRSRARPARGVVAGGGARSTGPRSPGTQRGSRADVLVLEQLADLREREAGDVAQFVDVADALQVRGVVEAVVALGSGRRTQEADLLVVADRPRRQADLRGHLLDAERRVAGRPRARGRLVVTVRWCPYLTVYVKVPWSRQRNAAERGADVSGRVRDSDRSGGSATGCGDALPADDLDRTTIPGPSGATQRPSRPETRPPSRSPRRPPGPRRHGVVDRSDDDRGRRLLSRRRRHAPRSGSSTTRASSRWSRSTRRTTRSPTPRMAELWVERTPPDFTFDIKAHALLTGQPSETKRLPEGHPDGAAGRPRREVAPLQPRPAAGALGRDLFRLFREGIEPLRASGQLGAILLQYPRWFFPSSESRDAILEAKERLDGFNVAVEFRHGSWFNEKNAERTLRFLSEHQIPLVVVDGPQGFKSSHAAGRRRDVAGSGGRALPWPADGDLGGEGRPDRRAVPLSLRRGRAGRMGAADRRARHGRRARRTSS